MRKRILFCALAMMWLAGSALAQERDQRETPGTGSRPIYGRSPAAPPAGPLVSLVQAGIDAYNRGDVGYFERMFAEEILWVDEDGHELTSKEFCIYFIGRQMKAEPKRKMTAHSIATGIIGETGWAAFGYIVDDGVNQRKGMNTTLFKKVGNDWRIVLIHGAINAPAVPH